MLFFSNFNKLTNGLIHMIVIQQIYFNENINNNNKLYLIKPLYTFKLFFYSLLIFSSAMSPPRHGSCLCGLIVWCSAVKWIVRLCVSYLTTTWVSSRPWLTPFSPQKSLHITSPKITYFFLTSTPEKTKNLIFYWIS